MKEFDYVITIRSKSFSSIDNISRLMLFISIAAFLYNAIAKKDAAVYAVLSFLLLGWFIYISLYNKKHFIIYYRLGFVIAAIGWFYNGDNYSWVGILFIVAALLEKQVKFPQEIGVNKEGVTFNSFPKRKHTWGEINNMVMKDGLVTIDYTNNKLFQKEAEHEVSPALENELNDFVGGNLKKMSFKNTL